MAETLRTHPYLAGTCLMSKQVQFPQWPFSPERCTWPPDKQQQLSLFQKEAAEAPTGSVWWLSSYSKKYACQAWAGSKNVLCGCRQQGHLGLDIAIALVPAPGGLGKSAGCSPPLLPALRQVLVGRSAFVFRKKGEKKASEQTVPWASLLVISELSVPRRSSFHSVTLPGASQITARPRWIPAGLRGPGSGLCWLFLLPLLPFFIC